ncbi:MAG: hypothetical protein ACNS63_05195 [Candidatus Nitrospinota bacterium M3_3B_026]
MKRGLFNFAFLLLAVFSLAVSSNAFAGSNAEFPKGWESWPIAGKGAIPDNKSPIPSDAPAIVQETIKTYNWINDGKGSPYYVRIHPDKKDAAAARKGQFDDGPTAVLELTDIKVILVTEHLIGEPQYGAYTYDGKDMADAHPSLAPKTCADCHSGYGEACVNGVCAK